MNEKGMIQVPKYFADVFSRRLSDQDRASKKIFAMTERVRLLIEEALDPSCNSGWIIDGNKYHDPAASKTYGIESDGVMTYVFCEECGEKSPIAIFKDDHMAAKYFVWLVSKGTRKIDWDCLI